jgi:hypothetical protein
VNETAVVGYPTTAVAAGLQPTGLAVGHDPRLPVVEDRTNEKADRIDRLGEKFVNRYGTDSAFAASW